MLADIRLHVAKTGVRGMEQIGKGKERPTPQIKRLSVPLHLRRKKIKPVN
jgi:hypothetical protein